MFPVTQPHYWALDLVDFRIGDTSYANYKNPMLDDTRFNEMADFIEDSKHVKKLIVDSGTTYFTAPAGLKEIIVDRLKRASCSEVERDRESYPDIAFVLRNREGEEFELKVGQVTYMVEETPGVCVPGFMEINVKEQFGPAMILGELFMRHHFTVFSRGYSDSEARIGFAKAKLGAIPTALREEATQEFSPPDLGEGAATKAENVDAFPHLPVQEPVFNMGSVAKSVDLTWPIEMEEAESAAELEEAHHGAQG